ncbi:putative aldolase class 2 protein CC_1201 isoform X2 [Tachypleus tridentatus]|uniref:putative aldolase class 2 protein CC_1201 isoform X2 n=1 Tax=Tachypleus tridentatus TaxID=6853 RepID=UPI003FD32EB4
MRALSNYVKGFLFIKRTSLNLNYQSHRNTYINFKRWNSVSSDIKQNNWKIRIQLAAAYRGLEAYNMNESVCNHLTALAPASREDGEVMLVVPYGLHWSEVTPSSLIGLNSNNEVVEGKGTPETSAACIHRGIYLTCPDVRSIMHTHAPYATTLGCLETPTLRMLHQNSVRFLNREAYDTEYSGLAHEVKEGMRLGNVLGNKDILFMMNHGIIAVANNVALAFDNMYFIERAAMVQILAMSSGGNIKELAPDVAKRTEEQTSKIIQRYAESHLQSVIRRLAVSCPEFKE